MRKDEILQVIQDFPGINFNEIARRTNLSNGVVSHYLSQLLEGGEIIKSEVGRAKYFHHQIPKKDIKFIMIFRNKTNYKIIKFLLEKDFPVAAEVITKAIKKSRSTVSVNMKKLEKMQLIGRKILKQKTKLTSDIGFYLLDEEFVKTILLKYNLNVRNEP